ncbi:MAG: S41 family peptidase [Spirochaetaceae bacterium]|nr:S41 family peptidase [Spirochaetaceae bacterium]
MTKRNKQSVKISLLVVAAVVLVITGHYHDISADNDETYKGLKVFSNVIEQIEKNYVDTVDTKELIQNAIQGMVHSLDPHSQYLTPEAFEELQSGTRGEFEGIGIVITMPKGVLTVVSPIEGTPAYSAGIQSGDIIVKVDGAFTGDMKIWEAVKKMRGLKGTKVVITVMRKGFTEPKDFELVRDIIPLESVKYITLQSGYGYVWITNFQDNTTADLKDALEALESETTPLKGLVLDLRNNPGGPLNQAIEVSDLFLEEGQILSIKGRLEKHTNIFNAHTNSTKREYPIIILINNGSASASEIVAGALQDHKRALIMGTTSFGKGSVQTVKPLGDGSGLKFTIARYYTPSGRSIQAKGIEPDIVVPYSLIDNDEKDDNKIFLKEKDLKNHLESESEKTNQKAKQEEDAEDEKEPVKKKSKYGSLELENLMADSQVKRALDTLISYDIFKGIKN